MEVRYLNYFFVFCLATVMPLQAFTLNWNDGSYTAGDTDHRFVDVDGSGIDVRVLLTGDTEFNGTSPTVGTLGAPVNESAFQVFMNWNSDADDIRIRMFFYETGTNTLAEVRNLTINIYDIDRRGTTAAEDDTPPGPYVYQDQIRQIQGRTANTSFGGSNIFPDITAGASGTGQITIANSGTSSATITGQGYYDSENPKARADLTFNNDVAGVSFFYGNGPDGPSNPNPQTILFGGFTFSAVPEPGTWIAAVTLGLFFFLTESRKRKMRLLAAKPEN